VQKNIPYDDSLERTWGCRTWALGAKIIKIEKLQQIEREYQDRKT